MVYQLSDLPRFLQISEQLARDVEAGRIRDGARLPPEQEMAADLSVSVGTLRKSLSVLSRRGLLFKRQGSGNYVRRAKSPTGIYAFFHLELATGGGLPGASNISVERKSENPRPEAWRTAWRIRRLRSLNSQPVALEEIWIDARHAARLNANDLPTSLYRHYATALDLHITRVEDSVGVSTTPHWAPQEFPLGPDQPCGLVSRQAESHEERTEEVSRTWFDPASAAYVARWDAEPA